MSMTFSPFFVILATVKTYSLNIMFRIFWNHIHIF